MPDFKRFWFADSPDGWHAAYVAPVAPYYYIFPLMGVALEVLEDGESQLIGFTAFKDIFPADEAKRIGPEWEFVGYFVRGSMNEVEEQKYFAQLEQRGMDMEQAREEQNKRPESIGRGRGRRRAR